MPFVSLTRAYWRYDICSISDTNYHFEKRQCKNNNLLERALYSAGFSIRLLWVVVDPCQSMVGLRYLFSKITLWLTIEAGHIINNLNL